MAGKKYEENEDTVMWRKAKEEKQARHQEWKLKNNELIKNSGLLYRITSSGECLLFRDPLYPVIDFYPSTGRWRDVSTGQVYSGGANQFISWYKKRRKHE